MRTGTRILLLSGVLFGAVSLWAQTKNTKGPDDKAANKSKPKAYLIPVYLGNSNVSEGNITKRMFDSLLVQGLTSHDTTGKTYKVSGFAFSYGERNLYEDSVGKLMVLTDYLTEYCFGDTLSPFLKVNIPERSKPGDTVYIDQVGLISPEGKPADGRSMRLVITK